ncbi:MAG: hypothetical protein RBT34_08395 [Anaerolineaceae bacterium]|jgi:hypothetical protein|nr:hypothetical protein [Anaerolineaceae bacterium]
MTHKKEQPVSTDLKKYAKQTNTRLIIGGILLLIFVGGGLIYLIYGGGAAITGLLCILAGLFPILLIFLGLAVIDWIVRKNNME